jgi:hypothetical protein
MNWTLPAGDGVKTVFAQYAAATDLGKPSETYSATIILDTVAPSGWVLIDGGAPVTGDRAVALTIGASDINGVATMCVKETANACVDSDFEEFAASKPYTITSVNDGVKNVYVSFRDNAGKKSIPCKASITLDTTAPGGAVVINGGQATTTSVNVTLKLTASKAVTMRISVDDGVTWGEWEPFAAARAATLPAGAGMKTVRVRYRDLAGNESGVISDTIELK